MTTTNFVNGTPVVPDWLNDVDALVYGFPSQTGNSGKVLSTNGSVLSWINQSGGSGNLGYTRLKADAGLVGDGVADDTAAYVAAIAAAPEGSAIVYDGYFRITDTVTINKRLNHYCFGANQGVIVDVGSTKDGLVFLGNDIGVLWGLNGIDINLNVYGAANSCKHAISLNRVDRSRIKLNVRAGATAYGIRVRGSLINEWDINSSANFLPPASIPITTAMPLNHMAVENYGVPSASYTSVSVSGPATPGVVTHSGHSFTTNQPVVFGGTGTPPSPFVTGKPYFVQNAVAGVSYQLSEVRSGTPINTTGTTASCQIATCYPIASNTNSFRVNLEGATNGFVQSPMPGEGSNDLSGEIEGVTGSPFYIEDSVNFHIHDLRMEFNTTQSTIKNSLMPVVGDGVLYYGDSSHSSTISIQNCRGYKFGGGYGRIDIDSASIGGEIGAWGMPDIEGFTCADPTCVQMAGIVNSSSPNTMGGGPGHPTMETLFVNPFFDIFDTVASNVGPPINVTQPAGYTSGDMVLETSVVYDKSTSNTAMKCLSRGTTFPNAATVTPGVQPWKGGDWVSIHTAVRMLSSTYKVFVYIFDGVSYKYIGKTKTSGVYETITGSAQLVNGNNWTVQFVLMNAAETLYVAGVQFYVGGLNVVKGPIPPSGIGNSLARMNYVGSSISNIPFRQGALAVNGGNIYQAVSNGSPSEWLKISP